ncbi:hypothetical protein HK099_007282 [Clydaea vesicula]|uniref:60S ribosomal protein L6 n=1 Tax=Clydaea vesicula TaxID=447962 RepID=A0AAD5XTT5_9FUNG|nr:hypothetical protein HK099_007282 [Clydaea vesicula]
MARAPRNTPLVPGVSTLSRSAAYKKKALFKRKKPVHKATVATKATTKSVKVTGPKNGGTRQVDVVKAPRYYAADDVAQPKKTRKTPRPATIRSSITPGTVLILLAGRFRGKRVVFLKSLSSGLLLVTGPRKINGVPLRRVNQAYVIATSTKLDISKVKIPAHLDDAYFKPTKEQKQKATEAALLGEAPKKEVSTTRVKDQKDVDALLLPIIKKSPLFKQYLNASFSLTKGQYPHAIKV